MTVHGPVWLQREPVLRALSVTRLWCSKLEAIGTQIDKPAQVADFTLARNQPPHGLNGLARWWLLLDGINQLGKCTFGGFLCFLTLPKALDQRRCLDRYLNQTHTHSFHGPLYWIED